MTPWLRCVDEASGKKTLHETYAGSANTHDGVRAPHRKDTQNGDLMDQYPPRRNNTDTNICGMLNLLTSIGNSPDTTNKHYHPLALLPVGNRHRCAIPKAHRSVKFLVVVVDYITK